MALVTNFVRVRAPHKDLSIFAQVKSLGAFDYIDTFQTHMQEASSMAGINSRDLEIIQDILQKAMM